MNIPSAEADLKSAIEAATPLSERASDMSKGQRRGQSRMRTCWPVRRALPEPQAGLLKEVPAVCFQAQRCGKRADGVRGQGAHGELTS